MSVLIKGIKMPKENAICVVIFPDGKVTSQFGVPHLGTAIPIPSHGRLIDADAFIRMQGFRDYKYENGMIYVKVDEVASLIKAAPTIVEAEEMPKEKI